MDVLNKVKVGEVAVPGFNKTLVQPNDPFYKIRQGEYIRRIEWEIKSVNREKERLQKRFDNWVMK